MRISGNPSRIAILAIAAFAALASPAFAQREARILPGANSRAPINIEAEKLDYFDRNRSSFTQAMSSRSRTIQR